MSTNSKQDLSNNHENSSPEISIEQNDDNHLNSSNEILTQRPLSPIIGHRIIKQENTSLINQRRTRSNSPRKTFSYLTSDRSNLRKWKQQHRQIAKQEEDNRIYHENRQKLERLAKIAKEPSAYPTINFQQEHQRERHAYDHHRKSLKNYISLLQNNLHLVDRLANVKGVYDIKKMDQDFARHEQILKQDANNRKKAREIAAAQRPFIFPKIK